MLSSLILLNKPFLNQIMTCDEKWFCMTAANSQLSGWIKKKLQSTSQSQTCTKKRSCHCLVGCWLTGPQQLLNPSETITFEKYAQQIDEIHRNLHHLQPALVKRKGPVLLHNNAWTHVTQPMHQKFSVLDCEVLAHSPDLLPTNYHFLKHLDSLAEKMLSKSLLNLEAQVFMVQE